MEPSNLNECLEVVSASAACETSSVSMEAEIPEVLYRGMREFIGSNPKWDQYSLLTSALANFLYVNGCNDRAVVERYLNDLFSRNETI